MQSKKIAYFLNLFPRVSERFIIKEVIGLRERGLQLETFALKRPPDEQENKEALYLTDNTYYMIQSFKPVKIVTSHVFFLLRFPKRYLKTLLFSIKNRQHSISFIRTMWQLAKYKDLSKDQRQDLFLHFLLILPTARHVLAHGVTHIHAHFADAATSFAMLTAKMVQVPYSFSAHAYDIFTPQANLREKMSHARFIITCTNYNKEYLIQNHPYLDPARIHVNYHGINLKKFQRIPNKNRAVPPLILSIGRMVPKKGMMVLLQACKLLRDRKIDFKCRFIGNGPERPRLEMQVRLNNLMDRIEFIGYVSPSEVNEHCQQARLFVLPCIIDENGDRDGIPNVIAEAMAMEVPVISTRISGIPELIQDGKSGVLLKETDVQELSQTIQELLAAPQKMARIGKNAAERIKEVFDEKENLDRLREIFVSQLESL